MEMEIEIEIILLLGWRDFCFSDLIIFISAINSKRNHYNLSPPPIVGNVYRHCSL